MQVNQCWHWLSLNTGIHISLCALISATNNENLVWKMYIFKGKRILMRHLTERKTTMSYDKLKVVHHL